MSVKGSEGQKAKARNSAQVIAIVGMVGTGKSVVAKYLASKGRKFIRFGESTIDEVKRRGLEITPENERLAREYLRHEHGMDVHAQFALPIIREYLAAGEPVVIDGLYSLSEYETLRAELGDRLVVIAVCSPRYMRYRRLAKRPVRPLAPTEAEERDLMEIKNIEKAGPIALADYTVINDGTLEDLFNAIDRILDNLREGHENDAI